MSEASPLVEAQEKFIAAVPLGTATSETISLEKALGRSVAKNITAQEDSPAYHRAIVEGFIVHTEETKGASEESPISFKIVGTVEPGDQACPPFNKGEAIEVVTGAIVADGPVSIVRMWEAKREGDNVSISRPFPPRFFIEDQGCDFAKDSAIVEAGTALAPQDIGTLASLGIESVEVGLPPQVTLFASGDEVIPYNGEFRPGLIRDCNSPMLAAAVEAAGGQAKQGGIIGDDFDAFVTAVKTALESSEMIVISGGTAVGGRDFISDLISEVGELLVDGVPMKSGRPLIMGIANGKPIVAVAGHPPEALRGFRLFGAPALAKLLGRTEDLPAD
ncbi:molybdopterin molybdotransferase MoeA [Pseudomonadota bacterium]